MPVGTREPRHRAKLAPILRECPYKSPYSRRPPQRSCRMASAPLSIPKSPKNAFEPASPHVAKTRRGLFASVGMVQTMLNLTQGGLLVAALNEDAQRGAQSDARSGNSLGWRGPKAPCFGYPVAADLRLESSIERIGDCLNNPKLSSVPIRWIEQAVHRGRAARNPRSY